VNISQPHLGPSLWAQEAHDLLLAISMPAGPSLWAQPLTLALSPMPARPSLLAQALTMEENVKGQAAPLTNPTGVQALSRMRIIVNSHQYILWLTMTGKSERLGRLGGSDINLAQNYLKTGLL
jgi:hypothetical protein